VPAGGASPEAVVERARPPIHFRRKASIRQALQRWPAARLAAALSRVLEAEIGCKTTGWPAEALCRRALLGVCLEARTAVGRRRAG
jgi:DNA polymerase-3 subunit delta